MERNGIVLSAASEDLLQQIRTRYPHWQLKPSEQAGFHIWHESSYGIVGDPAKLESVPDGELVSEAQKIAERADFMEGDAWQAFCQVNPQRALNGLEAEAATDKWQVSAWRTFLWAANKTQDPETVTRIAKLLLRFPEHKLATNDMAQAASWWLNENFKSLDNALLWPLWDRIEKTAPRDEENVSNE